jgi:hypothetical protein
MALIGSYSFADRDLMIRHQGGGIGHLQDVRVSSVDHEHNDMVQEDSGAVEDGTRPGPRGESNVAVESDSSESETDYDMGSGSERGDDLDDFSSGEDSDGYATP